MEQIKYYKKSEEIMNAITHGIGMGLSIAALVLLIVFSSLHGNAWHIVSFTIFGVSLIIMYSASTFYHSLTNQKAKRVFQIFDHSSIYILIAGTYTPFVLTVLRPYYGWVMFGIVWGGLILGICFQTLWLNKNKYLETSIYIIMGWLIVVDIKPLIDLMPLNGVLFLILGGVAYSIGAIFYLVKKIPYNHAIWHLFVVAGSICHFFSVLYILKI
ncbi:MAG: hemolysin III family protein [Clostridiaceae bacterium]